jgi:leader peptidase (prepilin peptidase)/N-methyltransferase
MVCLSHLTIPVCLSLFYIVTSIVLWPYGDWPQFILTISLTPFLVWVSVSDLRTFEIPDFGLIAISIISLAYVFWVKPHVIILHVMTALGVMAFLWLLGEVYFRRTNQEGLGIGDAKLFAAGALLLGPSQIPELILLPSLGGIALHAISSMRRSSPQIGIPFGPFITYAIFILSFLDPFFQ